MELALELGVDDLALEEDGYELHTSPEDYARVRAELEARGVPLEVAQLAMIPQSWISGGDPHQEAKAQRLIEAIEEHDDVQNVWTNLDVVEAAAGDGVLAAQAS
jgi:transcriptional/translational regulatory protein YebC/TACO1